MFIKNYKKFLENNNDSYYKLLKGQNESDIFLSLLRDGEYINFSENEYNILCSKFLITKSMIRFNKQYLVCENESYVINIYKLPDEYYIARYGTMAMYRCDQLYGLIKFLNDKNIRKV